MKQWKRGLAGLLTACMLLPVMSVSAQEDFAGATGQVEDVSGGDLSCGHEWMLKEYDVEKHVLECTKCGGTKTEAHTLTGEKFLGLDICIQGCMLNLSGETEPEEPVEEESFPLEAHYTQAGSHAVKTVELPCEEDGYSHYKIWYPADVETENGKYPVLVMCNGTGSGYAEGMTDREGYISHFEQMASWGFIVVANDEDNSFSGESAVKGAKLLLSLNEDGESIFYQKVDEEKIGVTGHSQGGAGCLNAATRHGGEEIFRSVYSVSATNLGLAEGLWGEGAAYDISRIQVPCCFVAGTKGAFEAELVIPLSELQANYDKMPSGIPSVMMRRKNHEHGDMVCGSDGYLVAWFLYTLCGDAEAAKVFNGEDAEIFANTNWQDVQAKSLKAVEPEKPDEPLEPEEPAQPSEPAQDSVQEGNTVSAIETAMSQVLLEPSIKPMELSSKQPMDEVIDTHFYEALYTDLQEAFQGNEVLLKQHFLEYGLAEGRAAIPFLDLAGYREKHPDLQAAFGNDWGAYLRHYLICGVNERRGSGVYFDAQAYADRYADLKEAFGYDVLALYNHYVVFGRKEGRNPAR